MSSKTSPPEADAGPSPSRRGGCGVMAGPAVWPTSLPHPAASGPALPLRDRCMPAGPLSLGDLLTTGRPHSQHAPHTTCSRHALQSQHPQGAPSIPHASQLCSAALTPLTAAGRPCRSVREELGLAPVGPGPEALVVLAGEESCIHVAWPLGSRRHQSPVRKPTLGVPLKVLRWPKCP